MARVRQNARFPGGKCLNAGVGMTSRYSDHAFYQMPSCPQLQVGFRWFIYPQADIRGNTHSGARHCTHDSAVNTKSAGATA